MNLPNLDHMKDCFSRGELMFVPESVVVEFFDWLALREWNTVGTTLDWERIRHRRICINASVPFKGVSTIRDASIGQDSHAIATFGRSYGAVCAPLGFAFGMLKSIYWKSPGRHFLYGASVNLGGVESNFSHLAEYDGADTIRLVLP
jgi:hypothetical protein